MHYYISSNSFACSVVNFVISLCIADYSKRSKLFFVLLERLDISSASTIIACDEIDRCTREEIFTDLLVFCTLLINLAGEPFNDLLFFGSLGLSWMEGR